MFMKAFRLARVRITLGLCATGCSAIAGQHYQYTLNWLGDLGGGSSFASAINDLGQVVGSSRTLGGGEHAFVWTKETGMQDLGQFAGHDTEANGINGSGQIVGIALLGSGGSRAWIWTASSGFQGLVSLGGPSNWASAINAEGTVVGVSQMRYLVDDGMGHSYYVDGNNRAVRWTPSGTIENLHTLIGLSADGSSSASGINDRGDIVGTSSTISLGQNHGFLWTTARGMQDLGSPPERPQTLATSINNEGTIVGYSIDPTGYSLLGFRYTTELGFENLDVCATIDSIGTIQCGNSGQAFGINSRGHIIGVYASNYLGSRPFVRTNDATLDPSAFLFPGAGWGNIARLAMNSKGQICGSLRYNGGEYERAFVLTPTCQGDLDLDGLVDDTDFVVFASAYDVLDCFDPTMPSGCPADLNNDGRVDDSDFVVFVNAYNALLCF